jgi:hypothetical protein
MLASVVCGWETVEKRETYIIAHAATPTALWTNPMREALDRLLTLANVLRRNNASKWNVSLAEWQSAVGDVLVALESCRDQDLAREILIIRSAVRRLANSGEARFASVSVGRLPDSSLTGERFSDDLERLRQRFEDLCERGRRRTKRCT